MALFISSPSAATLHGVYALDRMPPTVVQATGSGTVALVEQFPWGPDGEVYTVSDASDFQDKFAPAGMTRTGAGYLSVLGKSWPVLKIVRVVNASAVEAEVTLDDGAGTPVDILTVVAKYKGSAGNGLSAVVADATDGDADHFNLTVSVTGSSGTSTDLFENLNYSGTGDDSDPVFTDKKLVGSITKLAAGRPENGTFSFASGADGTVASTDYVGTQGSGDKGIALLESDESVDFVITADPGSSMRAAVNAGLKAHADYMTDRIAVINDDSGQVAADIRTDVASYRSLRCAYADGWAYVRDDVTATERLVPPAPFLASVAASLSPSTSPAWKSATVKAMMNAIVRLETPRGRGDTVQNTQAGVCTLQKAPGGGFVFEAAVNTNAPATPSKKSLKRTRMGHYIARSIKESIGESVDAPNVPLVQQDEINAVSAFLDGLKEAASRDPINLAHILDYSVYDPRATNTAASLALGEFTLAADVQTSPDQEKIFLSLQYGETVSVAANL